MKIIILFFKKLLFTRVQRLRYMAAFVLCQMNGFNAINI